MKEEDFTIEEFVDFWGTNGYQHSWEGYDKDYSEEIFAFIDKELGNNREKITVEIGAGAGYWTNYLATKSKQVIALDLIDKPKAIDKSVTWLKRESKQFNCTGIDSDSVDFVFSFGTFCHLSIDACLEYLKDIHRTMKPNATAILMYADLAGLKKLFGEEFCCETIGFKFNDYLCTMKMMKRCNFEAKKLLEFRDTLLLIKKLI